MPTTGGISALFSQLNSAEMPPVVGMTLLNELYSKTPNSFKEKNLFATVSIQLSTVENGKSFLNDETGEAAFLHLIFLPEKVCV